jgi:serine/threonine-protein kinase Chk2
LTNLESTTSSVVKDGTVTPPSQIQTRQLLSPTINEPVPSQTYSDSQTQPFSQLNFPLPAHNFQVEDEEKEGVWGYLVPIDAKSSKYGALVLRERTSCTPDDNTGRIRETSVVPKDEYFDQEKDIEKNKEEEKKPAKGYLVGRHPECGKFQILCTNSLGLTRAYHIKT